MFNQKDLNLNISNGDFIVTINKSVVIPNTCGKCKFFTGVKCHGHGDFWGTCSIYKFFGDSLASFSDVCYPNTICMLKKEKKFL